MDDDADRLIWLGFGPLAALFLGMLLVPFRDFTTASNFTFLFLVLTIVVAEFGGGTAALATALVSALSLDFFLTQPYLRLEIAQKHDAIAFIGLTICGLVAAQLGARRGERVADLRDARRHRDVLHKALAELEAGGSLELRLKSLLDACRTGLPISAMVLRNSRNNMVAAWPIARQAPTNALRPDDLLPEEVSQRVLRPADEPLPPEGGRVALKVGGRQVGWMDVWGNRAPASADERRCLSDVARIAGALLASRQDGIQ